MDEKIIFDKLEAHIPDWVTERWCVICYLIINWDIRQLVEQVKVKPDRNFFKAVGHYLYRYTYKNEMPPEAIAPAIMNIAEDFMSGNPVKFRAGDYISLQNFVRANA